MSGMGGGGNVADSARSIGPDNFGADCDGEGFGIETGGGERNGGFGLDRSFRGSGRRRLRFALRSRSISISAFFGQEEIVDGAIDDDTNNYIDGDPLPKGTFGISGSFGSGDCFFHLGNSTTDWQMCQRLIAFLNRSE